MIVWIKCKYKVILIILTVLAFIGTVIYFGYNAFLKVAYPIKYSNYVTTSSEKYGVDKNLIFAVIKSESNFEKDAQSYAGAIGLMQIMPETFDWLQFKNSAKYLDVGHLKNPETNIDYGTYLLSILQEKYGSLVEVMCAYNAGIGAVDGWLKDKRYSDDGKTLKKIPYGDTNKYVRNVIKSLNIYKNLYKNEI